MPDLPAEDLVVPDEVIARGTLPSLRYRDMPEPVPLRRMLGPSIILAGLALGSGEFLLWPYITYRVGFVFFWACLLGVTTQYFLNMEITRWSLATGESAITGFCRLSRHWAWVFLLLNILPWMLPAWSKGAAELVSWLIWGGQQQGDAVVSPHVTALSIAGLFLCGAILTAGPVIYQTVERVQTFLVSTILLLVVALAIALVRVDAVVALCAGSVTFGVPEMREELTAAMLLGALAFAGAGGTLNLGQSNYVKDKGYGMGSYVGRITSPVTGQEEAISETGFHFPHDAANLARWQRWWRAASLEHFVSFFLTCLVCLILLSLICYSIFYEADGSRAAGHPEYGDNTGFIWGEAATVESRLGQFARTLFLLMGVAIFLTTEFGVLDVTSRISTDIVKVNWLRENTFWTESRLYYVFLWGTILLGTGILLVGTQRVQSSFALFKLSAAMNGGVMFLYSMTLLYMNFRRLPAPLAMRGWRVAIMVWAVLFFGFFSVWAVYSALAG